MTIYHIKILAIVLMAIDHIGYVFFPQAIVLRMIGRLAFPLFAWLIANGAYHTQDINRYMLRIFVLAVVSQIPYMLLVQQIEPNAWDLNAIFSLFLGLVAIACLQITKNNLFRFVIIFLCASLGHFFTVDYGSFGVLSVIFFYLYLKDFKKMALSQFILYTIPAIIELEFLLANKQFESINMIRVAEPLAVLSLIFIALYNGKEGKKMQVFFYSFYPVHFLLLYLLLLFF